MACDPQSSWLTVAQVSAAALSPVIAVVGGWIAWQQVRINHNKLKLERFDKRFEIYEAAMSFTAKVSSAGGLQNELAQEFQMKTQAARFLINKELSDYLDEILMNAHRLTAAQVFLQTPNLPDAKREEHGNRWLELQEWFRAQFAAIPDGFEPYLSVEDI
ncbi:hypothetical protein [Paraburkholderia dipogonis]|uniref:hypothetical protein n=1 Tax=Paraburkholderia dipogonis TaxID=1211383 RepID=UPI0038BD3668